MADKDPLGLLETAPAQQDNNDPLGLLVPEKKNSPSEVTTSVSSEVVKPSSKSGAPLDFVREQVREVVPESTPKPTLLQQVGNKSVGEYMYDKQNELLKKYSEYENHKSIADAHSNYKKVRDYEQLASDYNAAPDQATKDALMKQLVDLGEQPLVDKPEEVFAGTMGLNTEGDQRKVKDVVLTIRENRDAANKKIAEIQQGDQDIKEFRNKYNELVSNTLAQAGITPSDKKFDAEGNRQVGAIEGFFKGINNTISSAALTGRLLLANDNEKLRIAKQVIGDQLLNPEKFTPAGEITSTVGGVVPYFLPGVGAEAALGKGAMATAGSIFLNSALMGSTSYSNSFLRNFQEAYQQSGDEKAALEIAKKTAAQSGAVGAGVGGVLPFTSKLGGAAGAAVAGGETGLMGWIKATLPKNVVGNLPFAVQPIIENKIAQSAGIDRKTTEGVSESYTAAVMLGTFLEGVTGAHGWVEPKVKQAYTNMLAKFAPTESVSAIDQAVQAGAMPASTGAEAKAEIERKSRAFQAIPETMPVEKQTEALPLVEQKQALLAQKETTDESFHPAIDAKIEAIDKQIAETVEAPLTSKERKEMEKLEAKAESPEQKLTVSEKEHLEHLKKREAYKVGDVVEMKPEVAEEKVTELAQKEPTETPAQEAAETPAEQAAEAEAGTEQNAMPEAETEGATQTGTDAIQERSATEMGAHTTGDEGVGGQTSREGVGQIEQGQEPAAEEGQVTTETAAQPTAEMQDVAATELTPRAQAVLDNSLSEYESASPEEKAAMVEKVKQQLSIHEGGVKKLGIGLDADMVSAGKEFLKQVEKSATEQVPEPPTETPSEVGKRVTFEHAGSEVTGTVREVDEKGNLKVRDRDGFNYTVKPSEAIKIEPAISGKDKIASGLEDLGKYFGAIKSATGEKGPDPIDALKRIGEGLMDEGLATTKDLWEKVKEYVKSKYPNIKIDEHETVFREWAEGREKRGILETIVNGPTTTDEMKAAVEDMDRFYKVQGNKETLAKADAEIKKDLNKAKERVLSNEAPTAEKSALAVRLIKHYEKTGDIDSAIEVLNAWDNQLRQAGRFIQAATLWNKLSPETMTRVAKREAEKLNVDLPPDVLKDIYQRMQEIQKMPEGLEKDKATLEALNFIASKLPTTKGEMFDAFRYQNMLSNPRAHLRNIYGNAFNTLMTRPLELIGGSTYDIFRHPFNPVARDMKFSQVPKYYKDVFMNMSEATQGFLEAFRNGYVSEKILETPSTGNQIETLRKANMPKLLTAVPRFMEAQDKFFTVLIGNAERARLMKNGVPEEQATHQARQLAEKFLYRDRLGDKEKLANKSLFVRALDSLGTMINDAKRKPVIGKPLSWLAPFVNTPINIAKFGVEFSPLNLVGGDYGKEQLSRALVGSLVTLTGAMLAYDDKTTWAAPRDPKAKELFYASGRKPYSIKIGDKWVPMSYFGPFAFSLAMPAAAKHYQEDSKEALTDSQITKLQKIMGDISKFLVEQTPTAGLSEFINAIQGDPNVKIEDVLATTTKQAIPLSGLIKYVNTIIDPVYRKSTDYVEGLEKDLPVLSKNLDYYTNPDGTPATREPMNYFTPYDIGLNNEDYDMKFSDRVKKMQETYKKNKEKREAKDKGGSEATRRGMHRTSVKR